MNGSRRVGFPFENFMINPMTSWQRFFNPQFYINYNTGDVDVENNVLQQVGSYGKQLGQIIDVLDVLVARVPQNELTFQERSALDVFRTLSEQVTAAVTEVKGPQKKGVTRADIDQLIDDLQSLARSDPQAYRLLANRLQSALPAVDKE
jgi:hypothetical protein